MKTIRNLIIGILCLAAAPSTFGYSRCERDLDHAERQLKSKLDSMTNFYSSLSKVPYFRPEIETVDYKYEGCAIAAVLALPAAIFTPAASAAILIGCAAGGAAGASVQGQTVKSEIRNPKPDFSQISEQQKANMNQIINEIEKTYAELADIQFVNLALYKDDDRIVDIWDMLAMNILKNKGFSPASIYSLREEPALIIATALRRLGQAYENNNCTGELRPSMAAVASYINTYMKMRLGIGMERFPESRMIDASSFLGRENLVIPSKEVFKQMQTGK
jgi:hypothetical protein